MNCCSYVCAYYRFPLTQSHQSGIKRKRKKKYKDFFIIDPLRTNFLFFRFSTRSRTFTRRHTYFCENENDFSSSIYIFLIKHFFFSVRFQKTVCPGDFGPRTPTRSFWSSRRNSISASICVGPGESK